MRAEMTKRSQIENRNAFNARSRTADRADAQMSARAKWQNEPKRKSAVISKAHRCGLARLRRGLPLQRAGPLEAEVLAQRRAGILGPVQPAALQLGHDAVDEVVERAGEIGRHDHE